MKIFRQIIEYFNIYKRYIGRRLYIVFILTGVASLTEGIGIAMLLPLIKSTGVATGEEFNETGIMNILQRFLDFIGVGTSLVGILMFIALMFFVKGAIVFIANAYQSHLRAELTLEMKSMIFTKYSTMSYSYYTKSNTGHFVNIINSQIDGFVASFDAYKTFLANIIMTISYLAMAFLLAWNFALLALFSGIIILFLFRKLNNYVHLISRNVAKEQSNVNKLVVQTLHSYKYLSSTAQLEFFKRQVIASIFSLTSYYRKQGIAKALTGSLGEPIAIFFILIVIVIQVQFLNAPLAPIFVALMLFNRALMNIMNIQQAWQGTLNNIGSLEMVKNEIANLDKSQELGGDKKIGSLAQSIELRDVSFAYDSKKDVLKNLSLTIPANSTVALVGESGGGKSTFVDMLTLLLRPRKGEIYIDGTPSSEIELRSWRKQIGYVSQETVVFDDTIANNICLWKDDLCSNSTVRANVADAARRAYADVFIDNLPEKYNTIVGDRGVKLSGGQRQRLFLARELYKNPQVLILDEATSALDSESEKFIQESVHSLKGKITVVVIAHRLSTIKNVDIIYVVKGGKIVEQGSYDELSKNPNTYFHEMHRLQTI